MIRMYISDHSDSGADWAESETTSLVTAIYIICQGYALRYIINYICWAQFVDLRNPWIAQIHRLGPTYIHTCQLSRRCTSQIVCNKKYCQQIALP